MPTRHVVIFAVIVGLLYAVPTIARGDVAPGIVGGVLATILCVLVFRRVAERQRLRNAERERRQSGA